MKSCTPPAALHGVVTLPDSRGRIASHAAIFQWFGGHACHWPHHLAHLGRVVRAHQVERRAPRELRERAEHRPGRDHGGEDPHAMVRGGDALRGEVRERRAARREHRSHLDTATERGGRSLAAARLQASLRPELLEVPRVRRARPRATRRARSRSPRARTRRPSSSWSRSTRARASRTSVLVMHQRALVVHPAGRHLEPVDRLRVADHGRVVRGLGVASLVERDPHPDAARHRRLERVRDPRRRARRAHRSRRSRRRSSPRPPR